MCGCGCGQDLLLLYAYIIDCCCYPVTQACTRGMLARNRARELRRQHAATMVQTAWRRYKLRQQYKQVYHHILQVQVREECSTWCMLDFMCVARLVTQVQSSECFCFICHCAANIQPS